MVGLSLVCIVLALLGGRGNAADPPIVIGTVAQSPYFVLGSNGTFSGPGVDKIRELFFAVGKRVVFQPLAYRRAVTMAAGGGIDGVALVSAGRRDEGGVQLSDPLFCETYELFFRRGEKLDWMDPQQLTGKRIILVRDTAYPPAIGDLIEAAALSRVEALDPQRVFAMLAHGCGDLAVMSNAEAQSLFLAEGGWRDAVEQGTHPLATTALRLGLSTKRLAPGFVTRVNDAIRRLRLGGPC